MSFDPNQPSSQHQNIPTTSTTYDIKGQPIIQPGQQVPLSTVQSSSLGQTTVPGTYVVGEEIPMHQPMAGLQTGSTGMQTGYQTGVQTGYQPGVQTGMQTGQVGVGTTIPQSEIPSVGMGSSSYAKQTQVPFQGVPGCKHCGGAGYVKSKMASDKMKACKDCVKATGNCPRCGNTGYRLHKPEKKCNCMYAK
jgi:hypothetical protein